MRAAKLAVAIPALIPAPIPGVTIAMGGRDWTVPPLTLGQLRRLMPKVHQLTAPNALMGEEQIGVLCELVAAALSRNYPEMTAETVGDILDLGNAGMALNAVLTGSGLRAAKPGEAKAGIPTGAPSTGSSLPASDGPTL